MITTRVRFLSLLAVLMGMAGADAAASGSGDLVWAKGATHPLPGGQPAVATFADNSSVVTGVYSGSVVFGPGEAGQTTLTSSGGDDAFIARYRANGTLEWARSAGGTAGESCNGVAAFPDGSCVITGGFSGSATFGGFPSSQTTLNSVGSVDIFIARYDANGALVWARGQGGTSGEAGKGVTAFADGSFVVGGTFNGSATFGAGESKSTTLVSAGGTDIFVARYASDGTLVLARRAGGSGADGLYAVALAGFANGWWVVAGSFDGSSVFGAGEGGQTTLASAGSQDLFVALYSADGTLAWARRAGATNSEYAFAVAAFPDGSSVVTGLYFTAGMVLGAGEANETTLTSAGQSDIFVARYGADGALAWARGAGGTGAGDIGRGVAAFPDGSSVVTGYFGAASGGVVFGKGEANETTLFTAGNNDIFVARFAGNGDLAWVRPAGGAGAEAASAAAASSDGSAVVVGRYYSTATFGAGEPGETTLSGSGFFVARYAPEPKPAAPSNLAAFVSNGNPILLTWKDNSDNEKGFEVERSTATTPFGKHATLGTGSALYEDYLTAPLATYTYRVRSTGSSGASEYSNEASATASALVPAPKAPSGLVVVRATRDSVDLSWVDNSTNEVLFEVSRRSLGGAWKVVGATGVDENSFFESGLPPDTDLSYGVRAVSENRVSAFAEVAASTLPTLEVTALKGDLKDSPKFLKDSIKFSASFEFLAAESDGAADFVTEGFVLRAGNEASPVVIMVLPGSDGWKVRGSKATWKSAKRSTPKYLVQVDSEARVVKASVKGMDLAVPAANPMRVSVSVGDDGGTSRGDWEETKPGMFRLR